MNATQTDQGAALGKWNLILASILGAGLAIASIWSLSRALTNSSHGSVAPAGVAAPLNKILSDEEIERRYVAEHRPAPAIQTPVVAKPTVIPTNQNNDAVMLQKTKAKVNQRIIDRMKQYVRDHPNIDTWDIKEQIKKRENQGAQMQ